MPASPVSTPLDAGFVRRVAAGLRYAVTGAAPGDWFGPSPPMTPVAPAEVKGRAFDFPVGANLNYLRWPRKSGQCVKLSPIASKDVFNG